MKIHFGGALPAYKKKPQNYNLIRQAILKNNATIVRDWIVEEEVGKIISEQDMYERTVKAIKASDAVILECSTDISAIGQQMHLALDENIPVLLLTPKNSKSDIGTFMSQEQMKKVQKKFYSSENINFLISDFLRWVEESAQFVRFNLVIERQLDQYLKEKAKKNKTSKTEEIKRLIIEDMSK